LALSAWSIAPCYHPEKKKPWFADPRTRAFLSRGDCHAFEQIISLYVDSILEQSVAIKQIAAYLKVAY
jgi:hypothetical protein